jgi:hypothetical protein
MKSGSLNHLEPSRPVQACNVIPLPLLTMTTLVWVAVNIHIFFTFALDRWLTISHSTWRNIPQGLNLRAENQSPSQETYRILYNPNVHDSFHNSLTPGPIPNHTPLVFKIYFNVLLPSTLRSTKWALSFRRSHQSLLAFLLPPTRVI